MKRTTRPAEECRSISSKCKALVEAATLPIHTKNRGTGQCVMVEGGFVLTAAHCVNWSSDGTMVHGDSSFSKISTGKDELITATVLAVEPVSDIAVLGRVDNQSELHAQADAYEALFERITPPIKVQIQKPKAFASFPVWIWTHTKSWVAGTATYLGEGAMFAYKTESEIPNGTSGGPIVNSVGELVGVVSHGEKRSSQGKFTSSAPFLSLALPAWVLRCMDGGS